jgi:hypothetical protein
LSTVVVDSGVALDTSPERTRAWAASVARSLALAGMALLAILIHGFHPYADDAGIYVSGVVLALHPNRFGLSTPFIADYTHLSIFSWLVADVVRLTRLPLSAVLLGFQFGGFWLLLAGCRQIARRCFSSEAAAWGALAMVAVCLTVPVAGTGLVMMDPYVTSRTLSTPCTMLAIAAALDRRLLKTCLWLALVAVIHPLMAIYAGGFLLLLWAAQAGRWRLLAGLTVAPVALGSALWYSQRNVVESHAYRIAALTRGYFYLARWQWYEIFGLIGPVLLFAGYCWWKRGDWRRPDVSLCLASLAIACSSVAVAACFAHPGSHSHLIARLQTLRPFLIVYLVLFMGLGAMLEQHVLRARVWRWVLIFGVIGGGVSAAQFLVYTSASHVELPWRQPRNPWVQAFHWVRENTPKNAVFALDANYIDAPAEDTEGFRAIARRASIADASKDGGAAAIFPQLAQPWLAQSTASRNLSGVSDADRIQRLAPLHVSWLVLKQSAVTGFDCPYHNAMVKVCRLGN